MGIIRKQSVLGVISIQVGQLIGLLNKAVLFPIVFFGANEYWGLIELYYSYAMIAVTIIQFGNKSLIARILPRNEVNDAAFLGYVFKRMIIPALIGFGLLIAFSNQVSDIIHQSELFLEHYSLFILMVLSVYLFDLSTAVCQGRFKAHVSMMVNNVFLRLAITIVLLLQWKYNWDMSVFLGMLASSYMLTYGSMAIYVLRKEKVDFNTTEILPKEKKHYNHFSRIIGLTGVVTTTQGQIMTTILAVSMGLEEVAIFAFAKNIYSVIESPQRVIASSSASLVSKFLSAEDFENVQRVYLKSSIAQFLIGVIVLSLILANIDWMLAFFKDQSFAIAKDIILIMGLGKLIDLITGVNANIISNSQYYKFELYFSAIVLLIMVLTSFLLVNSYGVLGVAAAYAFVSVFSNITRSIYVWRKLRINFFSKAHYPLIVFGMFMLFVALSTWGGSLPWIISMNVLMLVGTIIYLVKFSPLDELTELFHKVPLLNRIFLKKGMD